MFCKKCGAKIKEGTKFCSKCGAPVSQTASKETKNSRKDVLRHKIQDFGKTPEGEASGDKKIHPKWAYGAAAVAVAVVLAVGIGSIGGTDKTETKVSEKSEAIQAAEKVEAPETETKKTEAETASETTETEIMQVSSEVSEIVEAPAEIENGNPEEEKKTEEAENSSGNNMVEMTDPDIQREAAEGRESNDSLEMQENAEATEDDQLYGNYDYYGETPLSDNAGINVQSISTLEAYGGTLGENAPESGYVIEVTAYNRNNIPCQIYPMFSVGLVSPKYDYGSKEMILLDTDAIYAEGGENISLEDPTYIKPVTVAPNEERNFLYYLDLSGEALVEMIDERLFGGFGEKLPLEDLKKHKEQVTLDSENYLRNIEIRKSVVKAAQSASSLKDKVMISDLSMKQVDAEMYQIDMNISNENDFSCDVFPMLGCTATMVVDDWGREETVETYINGSDTVYGRSVSLKIDAEKFEPLESVGLAPHETKKVIYTIAKEDVTDITSLNGNPDTIYGDVKELKDIKLLDFAVQEAEVIYIPVKALDGIEIKKDVEGNVVYNVITFVNDTEDRWREICLNYVWMDGEGTLVSFDSTNAELVDLGETAELKYTAASENDKTTLVPALLYYSPDNSYME